MRDPAGFIRANTRLLAPPLVPELRLHLAAESLPIWERTEAALAAHDTAPPFWAFAWAGGLALARYLLDTPDRIAGRTVLDLGSGCGVVAIAAARAGAAHVTAVDIDPLAAAAVALNATANGVAVTTSGADLLASGAALPTADVLLVADLFYERGLATRVLALVEAAHARGTLVLVGDPQRTYFPTARFTAVATYDVPVSHELEDAEVKRTTVWRA
jgi:predicted nicotinamide N-methyase